MALEHDEDDFVTNFKEHQWTKQPHLLELRDT
jgi:hypothetical protein